MNLRRAAFYFRFYYSMLSPILERKIVRYVIGFVVVFSILSGLWQLVLDYHRNLNYSWNEYDKDLIQNYCSISDVKDESQYRS